MTTLCIISGKVFFYRKKKLIRNGNYLRAVLSYEYSKEADPRLVDTEFELVSGGKCAITGPLGREWVEEKQRKLKSIARDLRYHALLTKKKNVRRNHRVKETGNRSI